MILTHENTLGHTHTHGSAAPLADITNSLSAENMLQSAEP